MAVRSDDFVTEASEKQLQWLAVELQKEFEIKWEIFGGAAHLKKSTPLLNRVIEWRHDGISWEPDPRQVELIIRDLGLVDAKKAATPGIGEHSKRRSAKDVAVDGVWIKAIDKVGDVVVKVGEKIKVTRHGPGSVVAIQEKYGKPRIQVKYEDDTVYWCHVSQVEAIDERRLCAGCICLLKFGEESEPWGESRPCGKDAFDLAREIFPQSQSAAKMNEEGWRHVEGRRWRHELMDIEGDVCDDDGEVNEDDDEMLVGKGATLYRAISARINFLSADRADQQFCSKEASRMMSSPSRADWLKLKRIGRYLIHGGRVAHVYRWQSPSPTITVVVESNWAGCLRTRKYTTGIAILHGAHLIRSIFRAQSNIALSSAEAELYAMVHGGSEGFGARAMGLDFWLDLKPHLQVGASAAIGIAQRKGLGKVRHLDTQSLWIQDALRERRLFLHKVPGVENPGDMMTTPLDSKTLEGAHAQSWIRGT